MGKRRKKRRVRRFRRYLAIAFLSVLLASLALVLPWRWIPPPTTAFILQEQVREAGRIHRQWVPMQAISPELAIAVVAAEDQKFPSHHGFDFDSLWRALTEERSRIRGASTITQQLAKNLYLWPGRSMVRKGLEAWLTVLIELTWPKQRILEVYLNVVEFGPKVYGAGAASRLYFGKSAGELTAREATLLAAVLPNPKQFSPTRPSDYVRSRAAKIETAVDALGGPGYIAGQ
jgi:monofunctional biosynthetic peptidoglycan transglycosylase